jgi:hypothetical protein
MYSPRKGAGKTCADKNCAGKQSADKNRAGKYGGKLRG